MPQRQCTQTKTQIARSSKRICIPISQEDYEDIVKDRDQFRDQLDGWIAEYPELFPPDINQGYQCYGWRRQSVKMPDVQLRRICLKTRDLQGRLQVYTVAPSFILP